MNQGIVLQLIFKPGVRQSVASVHLVSKITFMRTYVCMHVCACPPGYEKLPCEMVLNNQSNKSYCFSLCLYGTYYQYK